MRAFHSSLRVWVKVTSLAKPLAKRLLNPDIRRHPLTLNFPILKAKTDCFQGFRPPS